MNDKRRAVIIDGKEVYPLSQAAADVLAERRWQKDNIEKMSVPDSVTGVGMTGIEWACQCPAIWPDVLDWNEPKPYREGLVRAGALIIADLERIDRNEAKSDDHD